ncbi:hypothetical protein [Arthrobacter sp.]|uniref:hypothetical protein n=1 Tax=Arthrobacter sp. TaxID=1667 RepID=UPI0028117A32|nr:hypothetical protein [Arthrobacter sp.]
MMAQLSVCYFFAAISKINLPFMSGWALSQWVWAPLPGWMFALMSVGTIGVELVLALGLWFRPSRRVAIGLGLLLHGSIVVLMKEQTLPLIAFAISCVSLYGLFIYRPAFQLFRKPETVAEARSS